jgi:membrane protein DedA with SNARE-associated domain
MQQTFMSFIAHYGYAAVFLLIMLEDFGMPVPGETALIVAAGAAATGELNIWGVLAAAFLGALVGDNIGYAIGHFAGRALVIRVGGKVGITPERYEYAEGFFSRYGDGIIVGARFVEILRQLNGIVAGTLGMDWRRFVAFNALGAALWVGVWGAAGYFAGEHIAQVHALFRRFTWLAVAAVAVAIVVALIVLRKRANQNPKTRGSAD